MYSVFSQEIIDHWCLVYKIRHRCKDVPTELPTLEKMIRGNYPQVMWCHVISTLAHVAEEAQYTYCTNRWVRKIGEWVCKNIICNIHKDKIATTNVKIRVAVDMLNKLENDGTISKELSLFYFDNIVTNCKDLWFDVNFKPLNELPF